MLVLHYKNFNYNLCVKCIILSNFFDWCKSCKLNHFQLNYGENPSGNSDIDHFLKDNYCGSRSPEELIEWIPYNKLKDIINIAISKYYNAKYRVRDNLDLKVILIEFEYIDDLLNYKYKVSFL
jgi:hypothetical protein